MTDVPTIFGGTGQGLPPNFVVAGDLDLAQQRRVLDTDELLSRLEARGVRNIDIARTLGISDSRVPEIRTKRRALKLDEAVKLVQAFQLEQGSVTPVPPQVFRLVVRYVAAEMGIMPDDQQVEELAQDVAAFASFAADPKVRQSVEAAEGFFQAMRLRRPTVLRVVPPGNDPVKPR